LYKLAKELSIRSLKVSCEKFLERNLTFASFNEFVKRVKEMNLSELWEVISEFGVEHFEDLEEKYLKEISSSILRKIIAKTQRAMKASKRIKN